MAKQREMTLHAPTVNIVVIGGGPAGLYFSLLMKQRQPDCVITVLERRAADHPAGWGVVLSDQALERLAAADPVSAQAIGRAFHRWQQIEVRFKGALLRSGGHGFCAIARRRLLAILRARCRQLGVALVFESDDDDRQLAARYQADLVIAADGLHSRVRARYAASYQPRYQPRSEQHACRYLWLGTTRRFDAFTFAFRQTEHGWFQAHAYQYQAGLSSVIVEASEAAWHGAGLAALDRSASVAFCRAMFADLLEGAPLRDLPDHQERCAPCGQAPVWSRFTRVDCAQWVHWHGAVPVVLIGDAAHGVHYSIGSGTRLALEDAMSLADCLAGAASVPDALAAYQAARILDVAKLQSAARNSMEWFEHVARYADLEPPQFMYCLLTRSQRLSHENLRLRDAHYVAGYEAWLAARARSQAGCGAHAPLATGPALPILTPFRLRALTLKNRIVVAPMAQYSARDGLAGDYHLAHLGARALGGAGLVFTEMCAVSAEARITPACVGMYQPAHVQGWQRIVAMVHQHSEAKIALQLGHAGPKGATRAPWDGSDLPLAGGGWPLLAASSQQYLPGVSQRARAASGAELAAIEADFVRATLGAQQAGFDWLELHCAHGYLLSSFISPLTNRRDDQYGGSLENRCRFPLQVFAAMRAAWPADKPISVRISAHDWVAGGTTPDDAVAIARLFKAAGADLIDCSSGQVSKQERPQYGRMYQTPFADRVRHEAGIATMAVGAISDADQANGIIAAGRADLCAVGRPHLANPAWLLTELARLGVTQADWPRPYRPAKAQLERSLAPGAGAPQAAP